MRVITLGNGRRVPLAAYVDAWRAIKAMDPRTPLPHGLCGWWPTTAGETLREFRDGIDDRINKRGGITFTGRRHDSDHERATLQTARRVNTPRLRVYPSEVPVFLRGRLVHRLADPSERYW